MKNTIISPFVQIERVFLFSFLVILRVDIWYSDHVLSTADGLYHVHFCARFLGVNVQL